MYKNRQFVPIYFQKLYHNNLGVPVIMTHGVEGLFCLMFCVRMAVVKEEQELIHSLSDTQLTESYAYLPVDTDNTVIAPLFIITQRDMEEEGQPDTVVS